MAELVHQPLCALSLLHDSLLVVLSQRSRELVVIHGRPVLPLSPQGGDTGRVDNLEDSLLPVQPVDASRVHVGLEQQLLDELPKVDVGGGSTGGRNGSAGGRRGGGLARAGSALWGAIGLIICEEEEKTRYSNIAQARDKVKNLAHPKWNFRPLPFEQNWIFFFLLPKPTSSCFCRF